MKRNTFFYLVLAVLFLFLAPVLRGELVSLDESGSATKVVPRTNETVLFEAVPDTALKGWRFDWDSSQSPYIEYWFKKAVELPTFSSAIVRAKFWCPIGCPAHSINVRFRDRDGEILQYQQTVRFSRGGEFEVVWPIEIDNSAGSWGCDKLNRIIDMPAKLHAMTVSYHAGFQKGFLYLTNLTVETVAPLIEGQAVPKRVDSSRPICSLTDADLFRKLWGNGDFVLENGVLKFDNVQSNLSFLERKFEIRRYEKPPVKLVLDTELLAGGALLSASFLYADKAEAEAYDRRFTVSPVPIPAGRGKTVLDLTETLKDAAFPVRIQRLDLIPAPKSAPIQLRIHGVEIVERQTKPEAIDFDVLTDTSIHVLSVGKEDNLLFRFVNRGSEDGVFTIDLEFENYFGVKRTERLEATIKAGEAKTITPQWRPDSFGHWNIKAAIAEKGQLGCIAEKSRSIAWLKPSGPTTGRTDGFLFSVCTHTERWSAADRRLEIEAAALCGVKVVRLGAGWASLEPQKGVWKWNMLDELVEKYAQSGIEPQIILSSTPLWAVPKTIAEDKSRQTWKNRAEDLNDWKNYVRTLGQRYKGRVRFYENWNEPDLKGFSEMSLDEYASLQKGAFEALRDADPDAIVMSGGFATLSRHSGLIYPEFQRDFLIAARGAFDVHAIHEHGWFDGYQKRIDELFMGIRKETQTTAPWYSNETAMTSVGGLEKRQAQTLFKKLLFAWVRGSIGYTWYDLRNDGYDPRYGEHHFGMVTNDFYPKEVYSVYNMLTANYSPANMAIDYSPDLNVCLYGFSGESTILLPAWSESPFDQSRQFIIETDAQSAQLVDLMGNEKTVEIQGGRIVYDVGPEPQTLKLVNATVGKPIGELVKATTASELIPGRTEMLTLNVLNPLGREAFFEFSLPLVVPGLKFDALSKSVRVPAGKQTDCVFSVAVGPEFRQVSILPIQYKLVGTNWSGILFLPLKPGFWLGKELPTNFSAAPPTLTICQSDQVTPLTPADPSNAYRLWKGKTDASGKVWLTGTKSALKVRVIVTDDQETLAEMIPGIIKGKSIGKSQADGQDAGDQVRLIFCAEPTSDQPVSNHQPVSICFTEIALAKLTSGQTVVRLIESDSNVEQSRLDADVSLSIDRAGTETVYEASIPWSVLKLTAEQLQDKGFRFDLLLGDDDGEGLDSWLHSTSIYPKRDNIEQSSLFLQKE